MLTKLPERSRPSELGRPRLEVLSPWTAQVSTTIANTTDAEVASASAAAAAAFPVWAGTAPRARSEHLLTLADCVRAHAEEFAILESADSGKPLDRARGEVAFAAATLRWFAGVPVRPQGEINASGADTFCYTDRIPVGVCAAITPNNYPLLMSVWKISAALAHGNCVVVKPSEDTSLSMLRLGRYAEDAGLPTGVLNVLTGGRRVARALCTDPNVRSVSFTGSVAAGREVGALCARGVKPAALELGGDSPVVVFADADLDQVVAALVAGSMGNTGQMCVAARRVVAEADVHDELLARVVAAVGRLRPGGPDDASADLGPMVSSRARDRVDDHLERVAAAGLTIHRGAEVPHSGYYVRTAVVEGVNAKSSLARAEVFGPVLTFLRPFRTESDALAIAHATGFGLAAAVFTSDAGRAQRFARDLRAGLVWVNTYGDTDEWTSVGGLGLSGYGRELGPHAADHYTALRTVWARR